MQRTDDAERLQLEAPSVELVPSYVAFLDEIAAHGEHVWPRRPERDEAAASFVERIQRAENSPAPNEPPQTTYWATLDGAVVGHIGLRHRLTAEHAEFGGHIGFTVRPSARGRGLATEMLRQVLRTRKAKELGRVLLTCAPDNVASNRTIRANGGVLERTIFVERVQRETNLYWIDLSVDALVARP